MTKLGILLKNYILMFLGRLSKKRNQASFKAGVLLLLLSGVAFIVMFSSLTLNSITLNKDNPELAISSLASMLCVFLLMMVVLKGSNGKKSNDFELLYSLPFKKSTIVLSKVLIDYLFDFGTICFTLLPGVITYVIKVPSSNTLMVLNAAILCFLLAFLCNAISILISSLIYAITKNLKNSEVVQSVINTFLIIAFIIFYLYFNFSLNNGSLSDKIFTIYPVKLLNDFLLNNSLNIFLEVLLWCIIPFVIAITIKSSLFGKTIKKKTSNNKELVFKKSSVIKSLFKNELGRYSRSTIYVVNTIFGGLFAVLFSILLVGPNGEELIQGFRNIILSMNDILDSNSILIIIVLFITIIASSTITTSTSISMEGKSFWILKVNPINPRDIYDAKLLLNFLVGGIPAIVCSTIICVALKCSIEYWILIYIIPILAIVFSSCLGLIMNIRNYNLEWKDETEVIKQSMSVLLSILIAMVPGLFLLIMYFMFLINIVSPFMFLVIAALFYIVIDLIAYYWIIKKGVKEFKKIN